MSNTPENWESWSQDEHVQISRSDGGIRVRVMGHDGWPRDSEWSLLIDHNLDATVRELLNSMCYRGETS